MIMYLSLLVSLIGVLMYALIPDPKLSEIGKMAFWVGLLAFLLGTSTGHILVGGK